MPSPPPVDTTEINETRLPPPYNPAKYAEFGHSFSGCDIKMMASFSTGEIQTPNFNFTDFDNMEDVSTVSISGHGDLAPKRTLGSRRITGYSRGPVTHAGTMIFTLIANSPLSRLLDDYASSVGAGYIRLDQLPPLDIIFVLFNEYMISPLNPHGWGGQPGEPSDVNAGKTDISGALASYLIGVTFPDSGIVLSTEDPKTEITARYQCFDYAPLMPLNRISKSGWKTQLDTLQAAVSIDSLVGFM